MYNVQHLQVFFRGNNFSVICRDVVNHIRDVVLSLQKAREKEVAKVLALNQNDQTVILQAMF